MVPTSLLEYLIVRAVRLLFTNDGKNDRLVSHTFLQKPYSFKFFSILEENCDADIINGTFDCETFVHKWCKKRQLSKSYLPTKALFFEVFQHFRRKMWCRHQKWNIYLFTNGVKKGRSVSHTFLQKPCSLNFFSILEEHCDADVIHGTFNCETFVYKW